MGNPGIFSCYRLTFEEFLPDRRDEFTERN